MELAEQGANNGVGKVHYRPHHDVISVDKGTTELRICMTPALDQEGIHQALMTLCMLVPHCLPSSMTSS